MITLRRRWGNQALRQVEALAQQAMRRANALNKSLFETLSVELVTVIDVSGRVLAVSDAWKRLARNHDHSDDENARVGSVGRDYLGEWRSRAAAGEAAAKQVLSGIRAVLDGSSAQFSLEYPRDSSIGRRWFSLTAVPVRTEIRGAVILHRDVTAAKAASNGWQLGDAPHATSRDFFRALVESLASALQVRYAFVSELADTKDERLRLLAYWSGSGFGDNLEYSIAGTPCEEVLRGRLCYFPSRVQESFPNDFWLQEIGAESYLAVPLLDEAERPIGHLGIVHDKAFEDDFPRETILRMFATRAAAEVNHRRREARLMYQGELIAAAKDAIIGMDQHFTVSSWNRAAEEIYGWEADEVIGQPADRVLTSPAMQALLESGQFRGELVQDREDGKQITVEVTAKALRSDEDGRVTGYVSINRDNTERRLAEEAWRQAEAKRSALLQAIPDMMFTLTADGTYLSYTPAEGMEPFAPPHAFLGRKVVDVLPPAVAAQSVRAIEAALESRRVQSFEYQLDTGVEIRDFEARIVPSGPAEVLALVRDYTAQRRQERADASLREIEELEGKVERQMIRRNPYGLTFREFTVLNLVAAGVADKEVADRLSLSIFTVNKHVANILGKMNALSRTEAAVRAQKEGLLP